MAELTQFHSSRVSLAVIATICWTAEWNASRLTASSALDVDETEITARPGEILIAPAGAPHRVANTGARELRLTAIHPAAEMTTERLNRRSPRNKAN
jgi:hypothetical protein